MNDRKKHFEEAKKKSMKIKGKGFSPITMEKSKGFWLMLTVMVILFLVKTLFY